MRKQRFEVSARRALMAVSLGGVCAAAQAQGTLTGWALLPADTFAPGPTSGQFTTPANGRVPPYLDAQPVQGFSACSTGRVQAPTTSCPTTASAPRRTRPMRCCACTPSARTSAPRRAVSGTVRPADFATGRAHARLRRGDLHRPARPRPQARLSDRRPTSPTTPNGAGNIPVDGRDHGGRLLTGADLDIESVRRDRQRQPLVRRRVRAVPGQDRRHRQGAAQRARTAGRPLSATTRLGGDAQPGPFERLRGHGDQQARAPSSTRCSRAPWPAILRRRLRINEFSIASERYTNRTVPLPARCARHQHRRHDGDERPRVPGHRARRNVGRPDRCSRRSSRSTSTVLDANGFAAKMEVVDLMSPRRSVRPQRRRLDESSTFRS